MYFIDHLPPTPTPTWPTSQRPADNTAIIFFISYIVFQHILFSVEALASAFMLAIRIVEQSAAELADARALARAADTRGRELARELLKSQERVYKTATKYIKSEKVTSETVAKLAKSQSCANKITAALEATQRELAETAATLKASKRKANKIAVTLKASQRENVETAAALEACRRETTEFAAALEASRRESSESRQLADKTAAKLAESRQLTKDITAKQGAANLAATQAAATATAAAAVADVRQAFDTKLNAVRILTAAEVVAAKEMAADDVSVIKESAKYDLAAAWGEVYSLRGQVRHREEECEALQKQLVADKQAEECTIKKKKSKVASLKRKMTSALSIREVFKKQSELKFPSTYREE